MPQRQNKPKSPTPAELRAQQRHSVFMRLMRWALVLMASSFVVFNVMAIALIVQHPSDNNTQKYINLFKTVVEIFAIAVGAT
jgi:hypothetical protein